MMNANRTNMAVETLRETLEHFRADPSSPDDELAQKAVFLAGRLQQRAVELQTPHERRQQMELDRLIQNPHDKATLTQLTDQAFRSGEADRAVDQIVHILDVQGIPRFFSPFERTLLRGFQSFGSYLPGVAAPLVKEKMRHETANVILPAEDEMLRDYLTQRQREGLRMNVNYLGEALLGERQAAGRLDDYLHALQLPEIEVISVKISTLYSQISPLAREATIQVLSDRLELLYRAASKYRFTWPDGSQTPKFVYLDMEEYRDLDLTAEAFMQTLDRPELREIEAGMALQAYLPDSFSLQQRVTEWARRRVANGGAPVTVRLVKGANLEMERVEASLHDWPQAPYTSKVETDANFKRMLEYSLRPEHAEAVKIGVASHNLFDVALGLILAHERGILEQVQFEMLEGMANHQRRALFEWNPNLLLYAPACRKEDFIYAIGYLIRRLDENTGPDNFLRHTFKLEVGSPDWLRLEQGFLTSFLHIPSLESSSRRTQSRLETPEPPLLPDDWTRFHNEPDTDFSLPNNSKWAQQILSRWESRQGDHAQLIPLVIAGEELEPDSESIPCHDPSRPGVVIGRYRQGTREDLARAIDCAERDPEGWRDRPPRERARILSEVAQEVRLARGDLMGAALADGGKVLTESDPEVSEAIDFLEFYGRTATYFAELPGVEARGKGIAVVVSPWNFPLAIPCGGIAAALAAGNTVILKPASDSVLVAHQLCECFWRAGVPRTALQFFPCPGGTVGQELVTHPAVRSVILTGGTATAEAMLRASPTCPLYAETGGKNATIVTSMSDRDQAIKNVLHSAFSHSGQKCSATSLLLLEDEVYDDPAFREALCDAVESLPVGSAWDLSTRVGPLIRPPREDLERTIKELEEHESWAVRPRRVGDNPHLYSPGVKWGVQPGSYTHLTEFFGPVLGVMRFRSLPEAIRIVNQTGYGLTSGIESLDDREVEIWREGIRAGNLYVNRPTTGAIVLRQPFGGLGKSAFGAGIKAGGPNYVAQFMSYRERPAGELPQGDSNPPASLQDPLLSQLDEALRRITPVDDGGSTETESVATESPGAGREGAGPLSRQDIARVLKAIASYDAHAASEFRQQHDHMRLLGQDNWRRYLPVREVRIRVTEADSAWDILARIAAARAAGCRPTVSSPHGVQDPVLDYLDDLTDPWAGQIEFVEEEDDELARKLKSGETERIRFAAPDRVPELLRQAAAETGSYLADVPVLLEGRIELLWYVEEQSLSVNYHRYGNLGDRQLEIRREPK
jgi:RHH-type transcriptional regulator, proline utilization regulon repressor / proline dehydrogenase / delta 1-pyrroline-5-carboxylate dehydrogenase